MYIKVVILDLGIATHAIANELYLSCVVTILTKFIIILIDPYYTTTLTVGVSVDCGSKRIKVDEQVTIDA